MTPDFKETNIFSPETLQKVIDYMEENLLKELTPGIIASHFFVNVSSLSVLFKTVYPKQTAYPCGTGTVYVKYSRYRAGL